MQAEQGALFGVDALQPEAVTHPGEFKTIDLKPKCLYFIETSAASMHWCRGMDLFLSSCVYPACERQRSASLQEEPFALCVTRVFLVIWTWYSDWAKRTLHRVEPESVQARRIGPPRSCTHSQNYCSTF